MAPLPVTFPAQAEPMLVAVRRLVEWAHQHGHPVVWLRLAFRSGHFDAVRDSMSRQRGRFLDGSFGAELLDGLGRADADIVITKKRPSGFFDTDLRVVLRGLGIERIVVGGASTNWAVESTVRDGHSHDYEMIVASDAVATPFADLTSRHCAAWAASLPKSRRARRSSPRSSDWLRNNVIDIVCNGTQTRPGIGSAHSAGRNRRRPMTRNRGRSAAGAIMISMLVAACAGGGGSTPRPSTAATSVPSVAAATPTRAPATATAAPATATAVPATATAPAMTNVKIQLDFVLSGYMPLLWGQDKGIFESHGLNIDAVVGEGSDDALTAINTGQVDFAFLDGSNFIEARIAGESRPPPRYTCGIQSPRRASSRSRRSSIPRTWRASRSELSPFSSGKEKIPAILQANGVDYPGPNDPDTLVELWLRRPVSHSVRGRYHTAEAGLAGSWESAKASATDEGLTAYFVPISNWGYKDYSKLLLASDDIIASDPDLVSRVVAAIWESETDALATPPAPRGSVPTPGRGRPAGGRRPTFQGNVGECPEYMVNPGPIDPSVFQYQLDFISDQGTDIGDITTEDLYNNEFIPEGAPLPSPSAT